MTPLQEKLFAMQDVPYGDFNAKLMPAVPRECVIGVRTPALRALAKERRGTPEADAFLAALPHRYFEENNLHAFLLEGIRDAQAAIDAVDAFLPYVDNWATCDQLRPKAFAKHPPQLLPKVRRWLASEKPYTVRYGIGVLLSYYLDDAFAPEQLQWAAQVRWDEYYVNMMLAWYFATALAKQWDAAAPYMAERRLPVWVHNKTIQKAVESRRISEEQKAYLRSLRQR